MDRNPKAVLLAQENLDINKFMFSMQQEWGASFDCQQTKEEECIIDNFIYDDIQFEFAYFESPFYEDIKKYFQMSAYAENGEVIYDYHNRFCIVSVLGEYEDTNRIYAAFTRVMTSLLLTCEYDALVYDVASTQIICRNSYLEKYESIKNWFSRGENIFPIKFYVNFAFVQGENGLSCFTLGFNKFNDYEIESETNKVGGQELINMMNFIVVNVISRNDKITHMDTVPLPLRGEYIKGSVKLDNSELIGVMTYHILF